MESPKKRITGRTECVRLNESHFGQGLVTDLWSRIRGKGAAQDDLIDALAMLWSAERLILEKARVLPTETEGRRPGQIPILSLPFDHNGLHFSEICQVSFRAFSHDLGIFEPNPGK